ncbi:MAG: C4-type zinc ribbon domain-containing protein [Myxococcota bacterium]|nr:C4-type zinc ribbon domain-containing protein [Myxococcota bacterium]
MRYWDPKLLEQLIHVQDIDLKVRKLERAIDELHERSKEEDSLLVKLKHELMGIEESAAATEAQHQMYIGTLEDIRTAIQGLATTKSGAPKPRTRSSTEALKIEEEKLSTMVVETEEQIRQLAVQRTNVLKQIETRSAEVEALQQGPEAEIRRIRGRIKRLERSREEAVQGIPPMLLRKYDRLKNSRSGIGLTILKDGVCTVCRMQLPTAIVSRVNNREQILACPACGRMVAKIEITILPAGEPKKQTKAETSTPAEQKEPPKQKKSKGAAEKPKATTTPKETGPEKKKTKKKQSATGIKQKASKATSDKAKKGATKKSATKKKPSGSKAKAAKDATSKTPATSGRKTAEKAPATAKKKSVEKKDAKKATAPAHKKSTAQKAKQATKKEKK